MSMLPGFASHFTDAAEILPSDCVEELWSYQVAKSSHLYVVELSLLLGGDESRQAHLRPSYAPSADTCSISPSMPSRICGRASPSLRSLLLTTAAKISPDASSTPKCNFRHVCRLLALCCRIFHSPSPYTFTRRRIRYYVYRFGFRYGNSTDNFPNRRDSVV